MITNASVMRILYRRSRVQRILIAVFVSLLAPDVYVEDGGLGGPAAIILIVLAVCWRCEWVGEVLFPASNILYHVTTGGQFAMACLAMLGSLTLTSILFFFNWKFRARLRGAVIVVLKGKRCPRR
jgi:hypothetical protein